MIYVVIAGVIFLVDSVIKFLIEKTVKEHERTPILNNKLFLTRYHNEGAFLNFGDRRKKSIQFLSIALTAGCLLVFVFTLGRHGKHLLKLGLSMLLGGAFSNSYDRLMRGYVVDYFGFNVKNEKFRNIIFNISDFFIMIGAALTVVQTKP